jgi:hypothetical protein
MLSMCVKSMLMPPYGAAKFASRLDPPENGTALVESQTRTAASRTHGNFVSVAYLCNLGHLLGRGWIHYRHGEPVDVDRRHLRKAVQTQLFLVRADGVVAQDVPNLCESLPMLIANRSAKTFKR